MRLVRFSLLVLAAGLSASEYPRQTLRNAVGLEAVVMLPDAERGYYRGTRMDHAGMVAELRWQGHVVFAPWRQPHDPTSPDHAIGLAGEFDFHGPQGFAATKTGDTFLKIGVGKLIRPAEGKGAEAYFFNRRYEVAEAPPWTVTAGANGRALSMRQVATAGDAGYDYTCTVTLAADAPVLTITHALTNLGSETLATEHYSHHFFTFDAAEVGPGYRLSLPFDVRWDPVDARRTTLVEVRDRTIHLVEPLTGNGSLFLPLLHEAGVAANAFTIGGDTGVAVAYRGSHPATSWQVYAERSAMCPEPFVALTIEAGATTTFERRYELQLEADSP